MVEEYEKAAKDGIVGKAIDDGLSLLKERYEALKQKHDEEKAKKQQNF